MEQNHDTVKQQAAKHIRRSGTIALIVTVLILIGQIISYAAKIIYTVIEPDTLQGASFLGYLYFRRFGTLPDLAVKSILTLGTTILLILLFSSLRKTGLPFTERNSKLMTAAGILQGLAAVLPAVFQLGLILIRGEFSGFSSFMQFIRCMNLATFGVCVVLLFLAWTFRYGIVLQQESDETL